MKKKRKRVLINYCLYIASRLLSDPETEKMYLKISDQLLLQEK
jgi:hypothetical protein